jgi:hypothetical protein
MGDFSMSLMPVTTGLPNYYIHIGDKIKVSNIPNIISKEDLFEITLPNYKIIGTSKIPNNILKSIIEFISDNLEIINSYRSYKIDSGEFIFLLKKYHSL